MVVDEDQRVRIERQAAPQHLPRINWNMVDRANGNAFIRNQPVRAVETEDMEPFDLIPDGESTIGEQRLPRRKDRILIEMAQEDQTSLLNCRLLLAGER